MEQLAAVAIAGGIVGGVLTYPIGHFRGWMAHEKAAKDEKRRKAKEERRKAQEAAKKPKKEVYDFMHDETMQFPIIGGS